MQSYRVEDITNIDFIIKCIYRALKGKWRRRDTQKLLSSCAGDSKEAKIYNLAEYIRNSLINEKRETDVYKITKAYDVFTHKYRDIASTSMLSQIYHWILVLSCESIFMRQFYTYQCASIQNRGATYGLKHLKHWIYSDHKNTKYCLKIDFKKCYQHIKPDVVMYLFSKKVRNKKVLWLAKTILYGYDDGLPIGSVTSQWFCNFVISYVCHYIKEQLGAKYCMFYMDDGIILGRNKKELHRIKNELDIYCSKFGLEIKDNWQVFRTDYIDKKESAKYGKEIHKGRFIDFMGYKFYFDHVEIRKATSLRIRRKYKKAAKKIDERKALSSKLCSGCLSYIGIVKHSDSYYFENKYIHQKLDLKILKEVVSNESRKQLKTGSGYHRKDEKRYVRRNPQYQYFRRNQKRYDGFCQSTACICV